MSYVAWLRLRAVVNCCARGSSLMLDVEADLLQVVLNDLRLERAGAGVRRPHRDLAVLVWPAASAFALAMLAGLDG